MLIKKGVTCSLLRTSCGSHMISYHICSKRGATTSVRSVSLKLETQTPTLFLPFSHLPVESIIHLSAVIQQNIESVDVMGNDGFMLASAFGRPKNLQCWLESQGLGSESSKDIRIEILRERERERDRERTLEKIKFSYII